MSARGPNCALGLRHGEFPARKSTFYTNTSLQTAYQWNCIVLIYRRLCVFSFIPKRSGFVKKSCFKSEKQREKQRVVCVRARVRLCVSCLYQQHTFEGLSWRSKVILGRAGLKFMFFLHFGLLFVKVRVPRAF